MSTQVQAQIVRGKRLARHVWRHFSEDRGLEEAASLAYTSLLAIVPLMAVIFGVVAAFPVFADWSANLKSFIFTNFIPAAGEQIEAYMDTFLGSVSNLTLPGTVALIVTALLLMVRIETAFNRIWRVEKPRGLLNRIVMYWAVLTLGPILIASALAISVQQVLGTLGLQEGVSPGLHRIGIFMLTWMVFSMMFVLVPNRRVQFRHALAGAFLTTLLFELAKVGFLAYVKNANYAVIYGALATIPIFLFWIYIVWAVVLVGASLAASLTTFTEDTEHQRGWPEKLEFRLVCRLLGHLWLAQREGGQLSEAELSELESRASQSQLQRLLAGLAAGNIITGDAENGWVLKRDLGLLSLEDLYASGDWHLPLEQQEEFPPVDEWDQAFSRSVNAIREGGGQAWRLPLKSLFEQEKTN